MSIFSVPSGRFNFDGYFEYQFINNQQFGEFQDNSYVMEPYADYKIYGSILNSNQFDSTIYQQLSVVLLGGGNLDLLAGDAAVQGMAGVQLYQTVNVTNGVYTVVDYYYGDVWSLQDINLPAEQVFNALATADVAAVKLLFQEALSGDDEIYLSDGEDTMYAFDGNDVIYGYGGGDVIYAGGGDDWIDEGYTMDSEGGESEFYGGAGNDTYIIHSPLAQVFENDGEGLDFVSVVDFHGGRQWAMGENVENASLDNTVRYNLIGNKSDNQITGNNAANVLAGKGGSDTLLGKGGVDTINGGSGADSITGGAGKDTMNGGFGADRFIFDDPDFGGKTLSSGDVITDFARGQNDKIVLKLVDANTVSGASDDAFTFIGKTAFGKVAGQLRFDLDVNGNTFIQGDTNGDGAADFLISLTGSKNLQATDFVL